MAKSVGITEAGDPSLNKSWYDYIKENNPTLLITKNPKKLIEEFDGNLFDYNVILHAGITGLGGTKIEPNVPDWQEQADYLKQFENNPKIIIRVDPIIPICYEEQLKVFSWFIKNTNFKRFKTSILDWKSFPSDSKYEKLNDLNNLEEFELKCNNLYNGFHAPLELRKEIIGKINSILAEKNLEVELCYEPDIGCFGCISDKDLKLFNTELDLKTSFIGCECKAFKEELLNEQKQCYYGCYYCYWKLMKEQGMEVK